jgi:hypothetical protein
VLQLLLAALTPERREEAANEPDGNGLTPLFLAQTRGSHPDCLKALITARTLKYLFSDFSYPSSSIALGCVYSVYTVPIHTLKAHPCETARLFEPRGGGGGVRPFALNTTQTAVVVMVCFKAQTTVTTGILYSLIYSNSFAVPKEDSPTHRTARGTTASRWGLKKC